VITMKAVCIKVYSLYPDFDLSDKKAFIKETVKAVRFRTLLHPVRTFVVYSLSCDHTE